MDGTVVAIVTREGQTVNSVQQVPTIVKIARLDTMTVKAQISEADVARVKAGQTVYFSLMGEPGRRFTSRLRVVEPVPESMSQDAPASGGTSNPAVYYNALFDVPNTDGSLRIAMTAQVSIVVASAKNVVLIPIAALGEKAADGTYAVLVRDRNGRTVERAVRAGIRDGASIEIREGIQAGEEVVLHGDAPSGAAPSPGSA
jgi:macrolide-specific efflux system membrane fusion protein